MCLHNHALTKEHHRFGFERCPKVGKLTQQVERDGKARDLDPLFVVLFYCGCLRNPLGTVQKPWLLIRSPNANITMASLFEPWLHSCEKGSNPPSTVFHHETFPFTIVKPYCGFPELAWNIHVKTVEHTPSSWWTDSHAQVNH